MSGLSDLLYRHPRLLLLMLLGPPLLWLGVIYLGALFAFLSQSIFYIDDFANTVYEPTFSTIAQLASPANLDIILRSLVMATAVTIASAIIAYPFCYFAARYAKGKWKALFYLLVMLPLWSSYLVKVYSWKLILAKEGIVSWIAAELHLTWVIDWLLSIHTIGGPSLSTSYLGTFIVFVYIWLPFMILPTQAAIERVPSNLVEASADLGGKPGHTFRHVIWPLALPGLIAGSIFTFSLTLGDYIVPQVIGGSAQYIGNAVYLYQGTAGNIPLAAAFTLVPIVIMLIYLSVAKRMGAFDAL
jgi:putative spermidine/putrescine transport system permease protein